MEIYGGHNTSSGIAFRAIAVITPEPDTVIRVNMLWYPTGTYVDMAPQDLAAINPSARNGFTVAEWGGEKYRKPLFLK